MNINHHSPWLIYAPTHNSNKHRMATQARSINTLTTAMAPPPTAQALKYVAARTIQATARRWLFRHEVYVQRELRRWAPFKRCWERTHAHPLADATYNKAPINALLTQFFRLGLPPRSTARQVPLRSRSTQLQPPQANPQVNHDELIYLLMIALRHSSKMATE